jgi:hypothetical protein
MIEPWISVTAWQTPIQTERAQITKGNPRNLL